MEIIRATEEHINAIKRLLEQVLKVHADGRSDLFMAGTTKYTNDELARLLKDDSKPVYVYIDDSGEVLGHCFCIIENHNSNNEVKRTELYIDDLCIDEKARGLGVGRALYEYVKKFAKDRGYYRVTLHVWDLNENARGFYDKLGLKPYMTAMEEIL